MRALSLRFWCWPPSDEGCFRRFWARFSANESTEKTLRLLAAPLGDEEAASEKLDVDEDDADEEDEADDSEGLLFKSETGE